MTSVPALQYVSGVLSPVRADLIPSPKRVRDSGYLADVEVGPRETRVERVTHPAMPEDIPEPAREGVVEVIKGVQREQRYRIVGVESGVIALTERVAELERDNRQLRGTASVKSQRVDRLQCDMSRMQRELRQMRRLRFYDRVRVGRLEAVGLLPVQQLAVRRSVDYSSSDYFSLDDSARDSSSDSSSEASSDFHSDASSDSSSRHSLSDHSSPNLLSTSARPSRKRRRSPMTSVPALQYVSGVLSPVRADLIPSPKRVRDSGYLADVEVGPRETRVERVTHPAMPEDIPEPAREGVVEVTYETLGDLV
nr:hypothetical protein [Tanacetum cinerariifolium]